MCKLLPFHYHSFYIYLLVKVACAFNLSPWEAEACQSRNLLKLYGVDDVSIYNWETLSPVDKLVNGCFLLECTGVVIPMTVALLSTGLAGILFESR